MNRKLRGFTLIELLVVIAIIAMLASVILASLNQARTKSRDARRVADLKSLQLALELYNSDNGSYPPQATAGTVDNLGLGTTLLVPSYISAIPKDPAGGTATYTYQTLSSSAASATACSSSCSSYVLKAVLENDNQSLLSSDIEGTVGTVDCTDTSTNFYYCMRP